MPFWGDSKGENYKAKLEHKMCIAKEAPDVVFDLSDCNLSEIPSGVFSMCRVFRKESLLLQNNNIGNLSNGGPLKDLSQLLVLNLKSNKLSEVPSEIEYLSKLQILNLEKNQIKKLPASFVKLINLRHLNLKSNKLLQFPVPICSLQNLEFLDICDNPKIKNLPKELCHLATLKELLMDAGNFKYPSQEMGQDYRPPTRSSISSVEGTPDELLHPDRKAMETSPLSAAYHHYQRTKERKQQELVLMEEALKDSFAAQSSVSADSAIRKKKLLDDITQEQERMENEIILLQSKKAVEKKNLLDVLSNIENHSAKLIDQLMCLGDKAKQLEKMAFVLEQDRLENDEIFSIEQEKLEQQRKKEILVAMTEMLQCEEKCGKYQEHRNSMVEQLQNEENESNLKLHNIFQERDLDQQILINTLLEEDRYQKEAFEVLQLQKDIQHREIAHQIHLIEKELSNLTVAEINKKDLKINNKVNVLAEHRMQLALLLSDLMVAKEKRECELKERLEQMEQKRAHEVEDFWLIQYQKLLDRKPKGVMAAELGLDSDVKNVLLDVMATEFLPLFASKRISFLKLLSFTVKDLKKMGILDDDICEAILDKAHEHYKRSQYQDGYRLPEFSPGPQPSAPPEIQTPTEPSVPPPELEPSDEPSAPPLSPDTETRLWCQAECVVCLDVQTSAVFLPCGHVCCCQNCSNDLELCPMCRTTIASKFILTIS